MPCLVCHFVISYLSVFATDLDVREAVFCRWYFVLNEESKWGRRSQLDPWRDYSQSWQKLRLVLCFKRSFMVISWLSRILQNTSRSFLGFQWLSTTIKVCIRVIYVQTNKYKPNYQIYFYLLASSYIASSFWSTPKFSSP